MKQETRWLSCLLTESEKQIKAEELAKQIKTHSELEEEKKASAARFSAQLKESSNKLRSLAVIVESGKESREVPVYKRFYSDTATVKYFREDTHEFVEFRAMTQEERQKHLFDNDDFAEVIFEKDENQTAVYSPKHDTAEPPSETDTPEAAKAKDSETENIVHEIDEIEPTKEEIDEALEGLKGEENDTDENTF